MMIMLICDTRPHSFLMAMQLVQANTAVILKSTTLCYIIHLDRFLELALVWVLVILGAKAFCTPFLLRLRQHNFNIIIGSIFINHVSPIRIQSLNVILQYLYVITIIKDI